MGPPTLVEYSSKKLTVHRLFVCRIRVGRFVFIDASEWTADVAVPSVCLCVCLYYSYRPPFRRSAIPGVRVRVRVNPSEPPEWRTGIILLCLSALSPNLVPIMTTRRGELRLNLDAVYTVGLKIKHLGIIVVIPSKSDKMNSKHGQG